MRMGKRLKQHIDGMGIRPADLCMMVNRIIGDKDDLDVKTLSALINRDSGNSKFSPYIATALGLNLHWLLTGEGEQYTSALAAQPTAEGNAEIAGRPRTMNPVKIKGFAKLGDNGFYEEIECDGWVDSYSPDPDAYGLRVKGDSMHPAIRNGSVVVIEPRGHLVPGEYVAIALNDGKKMVKELVFDRQDEIVVESVNGNHRMTIERKNIARIQPVAAVVSPSKWRPE